MKFLKEKYFWPIFCLILWQQFLILKGFLKTARIEEIPFNLAENERAQLKTETAVLRGGQSGIHAVTNLERQRGFLHLFHVPYVLCYFAAKGKWPFIPPMMQVRVDAAAKSLFAHDDGFIKQFCKKWVQIKECFRPTFATAVAPLETLSKLQANNCSCSEADGPQVFFDRDHIGKVSADTILDTIDFLESFLPKPTRKPKKRKNKVRGRIDEMEVE